MHKYSHKIQATWNGRRYLQDGFKVHHLDHIQITREEEQDEEANVGFVGNQDLPRFQAQGCKIGTIYVRTITCPEEVFPSAKRQATQQRGMQGETGGDGIHNDIRLLM